LFLQVSLFIIMLNFVNGPHQKNRTAPGPVVGWPPIRSFRKNLATSSSSKPSPPESQTQQHMHNNVAAGKKPIDNNYGKGLFVKINMDGVPIGRKVDLNAYHSYQNLSSAVDELFRGLLKGINIYSMIVLMWTLVWSMFLFIYIFTPCRFLMCMCMCMCNIDTATI